MKVEISAEKAAVFSPVKAANNLKGEKSCPFKQKFNLMLFTR